MPVLYRVSFQQCSKYLLFVISDYRYKESKHSEWTMWGKHFTTFEDMTLTAWKVTPRELGSHWHLKLDDRVVRLDIQKYWLKGQKKMILIPFRAMEKRVIVKQAQTLALCKESSVAQENAQLILLSSSLEARPLPFLCLSISFLGQGASVLKWHRNNSCHSLSSGESPLICSFPSKCDPGDYNSWRFRSLFHFT